MKGMDMDAILFSMIQKPFGNAHLFYSAIFVEIKRTFLIEIYASECYAEYSNNTRKTGIS